MTSDTADARGERNPNLAIVAIWLLACAFMTLFSRAAIASGSFPDPDDIMRLLEVRDWIGGQSWFDVTQYRLNGSAGVAMHWSRLVDVPVGAVILMARPLAGAELAETIAIIVVPLLTLGIAMLLVHRIALKLMSSRAALAAVAATPLSLGAMKQMRPMRIDHHGWQIVLALTGMLACLDERPRRSGIIAGVAMALWLNISLEGLPFALAIGSLFAFEWLRSGGAPQRLLAFVAALAITSVLVFAGTHLPSTWLNQPHDVVTAAYLAGFATIASCIAAISRLQITSWKARLASLAITGLVALGAMFMVDPHWTSGPFSNLDPIVRKFWYDRVDEGLPMWQVGWSESAIGLAQPIVGLIGALAALTHSDDRFRQRWAIYCFLLVAVTISSTSVLRIATTASVIAMPATAYLCQLAFRRARAQSVMLVRVVSTTAALFVMTPAYAFPASVGGTDERVMNAVAAGTGCEKSSQVKRLRQLPAGEIAAPLDVTPALLVQTAHHAIATGHHRNISGMHDTIRLFLDDPQVGATIIKQRRVDYVVLCPGSPEAITFMHRGRGGLADRLLANRPPEWLQPVHVPGLNSLEVWRVRKELLR